MSGSACRKHSRLSENSLGPSQQFEHLGNACSALGPQTPAKAATGQLSFPLASPPPPPETDCLPPDAG